VPGHRYFGSWLPDTCADAKGRPAGGHAKELLRRAHGGLSSTMQWLYDRGVLVVAAAGNDALREHHGGIRPQPRFPAYYEPVLSVAAADADGEPSLYSNRGDVDPFFNGITTFGGAVKKPKSRTSVPRPRTGGKARERSIVGLYCSPTLPGGKANKTGYVHWAGTSFSTPIVSALAALLWQQDAAQGPHEIMRRLRACAHNIPSTTAQGTDPDGALDAPYLEVWQEVPRA
jgi:subtilisin family serine protease